MVYDMRQSSIFLADIAFTDDAASLHAQLLAHREYDIFGAEIFLRCINHRLCHTRFPLHSNTYLGTALFHFIQHAPIFESNTECCNMLIFKIISQIGDSARHQLRRFTAPHLYLIYRPQHACGVRFAASSRESALIMPR